MKKIALALTLATLSLAAARPADAAIYVTTWTGLVDGVDETGDFGLARVITAQAFTATFTFDESITGSRDGSVAHVTQIGGGRMNGDPTSQLNGSLTINGHTHAFSSAQDSLLLIRDGFPNLAGGSDEFQETVISDYSDPGGIGTLTLNALRVHGNFLSSSDYRTTFVYPVGGGATLTGRFAYTDVPRLGGVVAMHAAHGTLHPTSFSVTRQDAAAVPEPAAWSLMIVGFLSAGAMLRRRRGVDAA